MSHNAIIENIKLYMSIFSVTLEKIDIKTIPINIGVYFSNPKGNILGILKIY